MTRSGRIYSSPESVKEKTKEVVENAKGKEMMEENILGKKSEELSKRSTELLSNDEASEFLKFIKQSEYVVVDQLNHIPAKISLLALLLNSDSHRNALLKVLNENLNSAR